MSKINEAIYFNFLFTYLIIGGDFEDARACHGPMSLKELALQPDALLAPPTTCPTAQENYVKLSVAAGDFLQVSNQ